MSFGIWNNLDEAALYLGLTRLDRETDEELYVRIKKFGQWKFKTDYYTQCHSIPLQAGLDTDDILTITSDKVFECKLDWEFFTIESFNEDGTTSEYIRIFINTPVTTIKTITKMLDKSSDFSYEMTNEKYKNYLLDRIIRSKNLFIARSYVSSSAFNLPHKNIIKGSVRSQDPDILKTEVASLQDIKLPGDYFIDYINGFIQTYDVHTTGFYISYRYYKPRFTIEMTDINFMPLNVLAKYGLSDDLIDLMPYILAKQTWGK